MPTVRTEAVVGFAGQLVVLALLATTVDLGRTGWFVGVGFGLVVLVLLRQSRLGPADRVTLARTALVGGATALVVESALRPEPIALLFPLAVVALALDSVDGWLARHTGTVSAFGARFDMEVDAFLILVLSGYVADALGGWVLTIGLMRYAFVAVQWVVPWMRAELPPRYWRKVVAATQGVVLVAVASGLLLRPVAVALVVFALALLVESFGRDVIWLWRHRERRAVREPVHGSVRRGPVRRGRHADPADRQRPGIAARSGGHPGLARRPGGRQPGLATGARPQ